MRALAERSSNECRLAERLLRSCANRCSLIAGLDSPVSGQSGLPPSQRTAPSLLEWLCNLGRFPVSPFGVKIAQIRRYTIQTSKSNRILGYLATSLHSTGGACSNDLARRTLANWPESRCLSMPHPARAILKTLGCDLGSFIFLPLIGVSWSLVLEHTRR